jgi:hypothetical protein
LQNKHWRRGRTPGSLTIYGTGDTSVPPVSIAAFCEARGAVEWQRDHGELGTRHFRLVVEKASHQILARGASSRGSDDFLPLAQGPPLLRVARGAAARDAATELVLPACVQWMQSQVAAYHGGE